MPSYTYTCPAGHEFDRFYSLAGYDPEPHCMCGKRATRLFTAPRIWTKPDVHYTSPIDGRPITSERARAEDLARNNCQPYDPGMKTDYNRRIADGEKALERAVDETVEREVAAMPGPKLEQLARELEHGADAVPGRRTVGKPMKVKVQHGR